MFRKQCPVCKHYTFEVMHENTWQCANPKCEFNSDCYGCKIGDCQKLMRGERV